MASQSDDARDRILGTAYELFCRHGIRAVGVDRIVAEAAVAKATLYKHFPSKDDLVIAALERREQLWTRDWLEAGVAAAGGSPGARVLAIFDLFEEWFERPEFEGCLFMNTLLESHEPPGRIGDAAIAGLTGVRAVGERLGAEGAVEDPQVFAERLQIVISGSIVLARQGVAGAGGRGREAAAALLRGEGVATA